MEGQKRKKGNWEERGGKIGAVEKGEEGKEGGKEERKRKGIRIEGDRLPPSAEGGMDAADDTALSEVV